MEINVKLMTEEAFSTLQKNTSEVFKQIQDHPSDATWLADYLGFEPYETKKYTIEDVDLKCAENYADVAFDNAKTIYEHLNHLPRYILCDMRFWAWFTFEKAYKQAIASAKLSESLVKNTWLPSTNRRNLMLSIISRYYFMIMVAMDNDSKNADFDLAKYLYSNQELYRLICYSNIGMINNVTRGLIRSFKDYSERNGVILRERTREIFKYATRLSSIRLIDLMSEQEVYDYMYEKIEKILNPDDMEIDFDF